jgi:hypothetical protein
MSEAEKRPVGRPVTTGTTPKRGIRIADDLWAQVTEAAKAEGTDATALTRDFYAWWVRRPGARMPKRPPSTSS